jgi:hypothetical protein
MSVLSCERSASRQTPVVRRQHLPSCPRVSRGSPLLPEGASGFSPPARGGEERSEGWWEKRACSEPTHTRLDAASRGPGKSEARGGGRSEHARSRCRPDAMQRGGARSGTEGDGVVGVDPRFTNHDSRSLGLSRLASDVWHLASPIALSRHAVSRHALSRHAVSCHALPTNG